MVAYQQPLQQTDGANSLSHTSGLGGTFPFLIVVAGPVQFRFQKQADLPKGHCCTLLKVIIYICLFTYI